MAIEIMPARGFGEFGVGDGMGGRKSEVYSRERQSRSEGG